MLGVHDVQKERLEVALDFLSFGLATFLLQIEDVIIKSKVVLDERHTFSSIASTRIVRRASACDAIAVIVSCMSSTGSL